jgi:hypothetical protein
LATADGGPGNAISAPDLDVVGRIVKCTSAGKEAVLLQDRVDCQDYRKGAAFLRSEAPDMPLKLDVNDICTTSGDKPRDWRHVPGDAIKRISTLTKSVVDPRGIRILGAIFCEELDLAGLDLPYSLILDKSLFIKGFEARNFHTRGDLSLDGSVAPSLVGIRRSRIDGSIFASDAYIDRLHVFDTEVKGSLILRGSTIDAAIFDTIALSGELGMRGTKLSYLLLQFSSVGAVFDLTDSRARCAYAIRKSQIGDLVLVDAGFGASTVPPALAKDKHECKYSAIALPGTFRLSDTHVRSSVCLRSFHWLSDNNAQDGSIVTFDAVGVGDSSFIDLAPPSTETGQKRRFEAIGLKTRSFIFNFEAGARMPTMSVAVAGLVFEHVYTHAAIQCAYDSEYFRPPSGDAELRLANVPRSELRIPKVDEVMSWLNNNCLQTTQPLSAFVESATKSGDLTDAKQFQIARETKELRLRIQRILGVDKGSNCRNTPEAAIGSHISETADILFPFNWVSDVVAIMFGSLLWLVADHGYRPQKVGWIVAATIVGAAAYFWLRIKIVAFMPVKKDVVRPIGLAFLFDRLLPAYRIREENYNIEAYYKLASKANQSADEPKYIRYLHIFGFKIPVVKADEEDVRHVDRCLDIIKAVGIVLAIFLVAMVNALFSH